MPSNVVSTYLKYANLQMAAESLFGVTSTDPAGTVKGAEAMTQAELEQGNNRSTKFTTVLADQFLADWEVVAHQGDITTGFSGTLFRVKKDQALVIWDAPVGSTSFAPRSPGRPRSAAVTPASASL